MTETSGFGGRLRAARLAKGMSLGQLAAAVGVPTATLRRWEREEAAPPALAREHLTDLLDLDGTPDPATTAMPTPGTDDVEAEAAAGGGPELGGRPTEAMPVPRGSVVTPAPSATPPPAVPRTFVGRIRAALFDPEQPWLGYLRSALTVVTFAVMLVVLGWAVRELLAALGQLLRTVGTATTDTTFGVLWPVG